MHKGILTIDRSLFTKENSQLLKTIFSNFYPIDIRQNHGFVIHETITYFGYSDLFHETEIGEIVPEYKIEWILDNDGIVSSFCFERI